MADPVPLRVAQGSYLCTVSFYRMPDGSIRAALEEMPAHVVESEDTIKARFSRVAQWCVAGALDLRRQGQEFAEGEEHG